MPLSLLVSYLWLKTKENRVARKCLAPCSLHTVRVEAHRKCTGVNDLELRGQAAFKALSRSVLRDEHTAPGEVLNTRGLPQRGKHEHRKDY